MSPEVARVIDRVTRRGRSAQPPRGLNAPGQYRAWILERIDRLAKSDVTDAERAETDRWRAEVAEADAQSLWAEYDATRIF
jgi:hypothetical protein